MKPDSYSETRFSNRVPDNPWVPYIASMGSVRYWGTCHRQQFIPIHFIVYPHINRHILEQHYILTSKCMLVNAFAWSKTMKNIQCHEKSNFFIMHTRGSCKGHERKRRKKIVGQRFGVTPRSWLSPKSWLLSCNVVVFQSFSTRATYAHEAKSSLKSKGVIISKQIQYQQLLYINDISNCEC